MLLILEHNNFFHKYNINQKNKVSSDKINKRGKKLHLIERKPHYHVIKFSSASVVAASINGNNSASWSKHDCTC